METLYPLSVLQQMTFAFQNEYGLYLFLAALVFGFILSFAVGANDSANSWGEKKTFFWSYKNYNRAYCRKKFLILKDDALDLACNRVLIEIEGAIKE